MCISLYNKIEKEQKGKSFSFALYVVLIKSTIIK